MVQSYARTRETVADVHHQVDLTLMALNALRNAPAGNMKDAFSQYKDAVGALETERGSAQWRETTMKEESEDHIRAWQREMESIDDPMIKSSLESRREAVRTNFALFQMYVDDAKKAFDPFLRGNKGLVQALSIDLSPAAMSSLSPSMDRVMTDGQALKQRIMAVQRALDNIANGVSPIGN